MSDYYLFRKYGVCALSQTRILSWKNYFKAMTSSRMYRIFVILAILMTSSSDDVIKWWRHQIFKFWILQFIFLHCAELLWKNQVSIINNPKVITILHFEYFPFWANFEDFSVNHLSVKNRKKNLHIYIKLKFLHDVLD